MKLHFQHFGSLSVAYGRLTYTWTDTWTDTWQRCIYIPPPFVKNPAGFACKPPPFACKPPPFAGNMSACRHSLSFLSKHSFRWINIQPQFRCRKCRKCWFFLAISYHYAETIRWNTLKRRIRLIFLWIAWRFGDFFLSLQRRLAAHSWAAGGLIYEKDVFGRLSLWVVNLRVQISTTADDNEASA